MVMVFLKSSSLTKLIQSVCPHKRRNESRDKRQVTNSPEDGLCCVRAARESERRGAARVYTARRTLPPSWPALVLQTRRDWRKEGGRGPAAAATRAGRTKEREREKRDGWTDRRALVWGGFSSPSFLLFFSARSLVFQREPGEETKWGVVVFCRQFLSYFRKTLYIFNQLYVR